MKKYFLHNETEQQGPFDLDDLKTRKISKQTSIWYEGLQEWTTADKVEELKSLFANVPPEFKQSATPPPLKNVAAQDEILVQPKIKKGHLLKYTFIVVVLLAISWGIYTVSQNWTYDSGTYEAPAETYQEKVMTVEEIEKSQPTNFLTAGGNYNENFWGNKIKVHGTITNTASVATYKDAVVRITYYSKTKTELGTHEYTIYETFPPTSTKNFELKIETYKDVNSIGWEVISAQAN